MKENRGRKAAEYKNFPLMILTNEHEFVFRILPLVENPFLSRTVGDQHFNHEPGMITSVDEDH
jgi:hypothetical protein